jgi:hypothetical protein
MGLSASTGRAEADKDAGASWEDRVNNPTVRSPAPQRAPERTTGAITVVLEASLGVTEDEAGSTSDRGAAFGLPAPTSPFGRNSTMRHLVRSLPLVIALSAPVVLGPALAANAQGAVAHVTMQVTKTGTITKFESASSFSISVSKTTYVVKTNDMTHVTIDMKSAKVSNLKKGDAVTVKGPLEMSTITATSVVDAM